MGGINNHGSLGQTLELNEYMRADLDDQIDSIYLVQEPWYDDDSTGKNTPIQPGYKSIATRAPRAAIYYQDRYPIIKIAHLTNRDMAVGTITKGNKTPIYLISLYVDRAAKQWPPEFFKKAIHEIKSKNATAIICMDANGEHASWSGRGLSNHAGNSMHNYLRHHNIYVHNTPTDNNNTYEQTKYWEETMTTETTKTWIDISCTVGKHEILKHWDVTDIKIADHYMISMKADLGEYERIKTWKLDLEKFRKQLTHDIDLTYDKIPEKITPEILDRMAGILEKHIDLARKENRKEIYIKKEHYIKKYWNPRMEEIKHKIAGLEIDRKNSIRDRQPETRIKELSNLINKNRRQLKATLKKAKKEYDKRTMEEMHTVKEMAKLWNRGKQKNYQQINQVYRFENAEEITETPLEAVVELGLAHNLESQLIHTPEDFPEAKPGYINTLPSNYNDINTNNPRFIQKSSLDTKYFDLETTKSLLMTFGPDKMGGLDGISPKLFQHLPENVLIFLTTLYQACIELERTPARWTIAKSIFLPKPKKTDYKLLRSWRPLGLLQFAFRLYEKGLKQYMKQNELIGRNDFNPNQHGFRKGKSCETALTQLIQNLEDHTTNATGKYSLMCSIDFEGAFDAVHPAKMREAMTKKNVDPKIINWFMHLMDNKKTVVTAGEEQALLKCPRGVFQGGVLSPTVWNYVIDTIFPLIPRNVQVTAYADDLSFVVNWQEGFEETKELMQHTLNIVAKWAEENQIKIAPQKSQAMWVRSIRDNPPTQVTLNDCLILNGMPIKFVTDIKTLGVIIDDTCSFGKHIDEKINVAETMVNKLGWWISPFKGPRPQLMRWAYMGILAPQLTYCCHLWSHKLTSKQKTKINRLNRKYLKSMAPVRASSPLHGLAIIYDMMPLLNIIDLRALSTAVRVSKVIELSDMSMRIHGHLYKLQKILKEKVKITDFKTDEVEKETIIRNKFQINENSLSKDAKGIIKIKNDRLQVFTDGSKKDGKIGYGYTITKKGEEKEIGLGRLPDRCTVFHAEIMAILQATRVIRHRHASNTKRIDFMIDSRAAIMAIRRNEVKTTLVKECKEELNKLATNIKVRIRWVKAHNENTVRNMKNKDQIHDGNTKADEYAKAGGQLAFENITNEPSLGSQTKNDIKVKINDYCHKLWNDWWQHLKKQQLKGAKNTCRQTREWFPHRMAKKSREILRLNKLNCGLLTSFITGHLFLRYHESLIDKGETDPTCSECKDPISSDINDIRQNGETASHLLRRCDAFIHKRLNVIGTSTIKTYDKWSPMTILRLIKVTGLHMKNWDKISYLQVSNYNDERALAEDLRELQGHSTQDEDDPDDFDPGGEYMSIHDTNNTTLREALDRHTLM